MTLVVLGLDGLDARLVEEFGIGAFELRSHGAMETVAYNREEPHTKQVWPSMATGLPPGEHGIGVHRSSTWDNPVLEFLSKHLAPYLSLEWRVYLGDVASGTTGSDWRIATVDSETFFDGPGRFCHNWPGIDNSALEEAWAAIEYAQTNSSPQRSFERGIWGLAAEKFGWAKEMLHHPASLAGVHVHLPDSVGHAYATQYDHLQRQYERVGEYVDELVDYLGTDDDLLVVSDHGIQVEWFDDEKVGEHSWHSFSASTRSTRPGSVMDVRSWIESNVGSHERAFTRRETSELDLPTEILKNLGYVD